MSPEMLRFSLLLIDTFCFVYSVPIRVLKSMHCVTANYSRVTNLLWKKSLALLLFYIMRGCRRFCQRGSNFDNGFLFVMFFCVCVFLVYEGWPL